MDKTEKIEAYSDPLFADYYDFMVDALPPEMEVGVDVEFYSNILTQNQSQNLRILDLAAGTGRISYGIAKTVAQKNPEIHLNFILVDNSEKMIQNAKKQAPEISNVKFEYFVGDMSNFPSELEQKLIQNPVDFCVIGAGSITHLQQKKQLNQLFQSVKGALKRDGNFALEILDKKRIVPSKEELSQQQEQTKDKNGFIMQTKSILVQMDEDGDGEQVVTSEFDLYNPDGKMTSTFWILRAWSIENVVKILQDNGFEICAGWKSFTDALKNPNNDEVVEGSTVLISEIK
eukprot:TRINITY_DN19337_c0_g2_i1.p2 TRINITY_DN19337_c0_g2~~TRINITY_DN19337_c0_g2_i1.p2  ORF type:complete len:288 (-),score=69.81 TRINITY_DN19337_c0_g2_i1:383-1246(-)